MPEYFVVGEGFVWDIPQPAWLGVIDSSFERMAKRVYADGGFFTKLD